MSNTSYVIKSLDRIALISLLAMVMGACGFWSAKDIFEYLISGSLLLLNVAILRLIYVSYFFEESKETSSGP